MVGSNPKQCTAVTRGGTRCQSPMVGEDGFCFTHSPERAAERKQARSRGGHQRSSMARVRKASVGGPLGALYDKLEKALDDVLAVRIHPASATAAASLARAMIAVIEAGEMEERVAALEEQLAIAHELRDELRDQLAG